MTYIIDYGLPWHATDYTGTNKDLGTPGICSDSWETFIVPPGEIPAPEVTQRIVECCNACEGIEDPGSLLKELQGRLIDLEVDLVRIARNKVDPVGQAECSLEVVRDLVAKLGKG